MKIFNKSLLIGTMVFMFMAVSSPAQAQTMNSNTVTVDKAVMTEILSKMLVLLEDFKSNDGMNGEPTPNTDAADLRVTLNALLREHVNLGLGALYNVIENNNATEGSVAALDENTVELAATVGSVYGDEAEDQFRQIWRDHIGFFANYATGLRTNDEEMMDKAEDNLKDYQHEIADFFSTAVPSIEEDTVIAGSGEHKDLLIEAMNHYEAGDYEEAYETQREADKQISGIANLLATGIVMQYPEKF